jgi:hypothetical protein
MGSGAHPTRTATPCSPGGWGSVAKTVEPGVAGKIHGYAHLCFAGQADRARID